MLSGVSIFQHTFFTLVVLLMLTSGSCKKNESPSSSNNQQSDSTLTIRYNYIELDKIERISKFRSAVGHDYSDDVEDCRSMKHYFQPKGTVNWGTVKIFSPVNGTIVRITEEWAGTQLHIEVSENPSYTIIIFHIAAIRTFTLGDKVRAGEQLGTHIGSQTMSDIAVSYSGNNKWRLLSYFTLLTDSLFQYYVQRGVSSRADFIITKEARDADPLHCAGDAFTSEGTLPNWVELK
jgi:hypothetical protein